MIKKDSVVFAYVLDIQKHFVTLSFAQYPDWLGVIHVSEVSDFYVRDLTQLIHIGDHIPVKVLEVNFNTKRIFLSYKNLNPRFLKNPFKFTIKQTKKGFKTLSKWIESIK